MAKNATGIDIGLRTAKALRGYVKESTFVVTGFATANYIAEDTTQGWTQLPRDFKPATARIGLTGREVNIRYTRVPRVPDWQLRKLMSFEVAEVGGQSGTEVASDFNVLPELPEIEGEDVVLLCMARESLLTSHMDGLKSIGGSLDAFTPNSIALYNAWLHYGVVMEDTVLVANIGHDNLDVVLVRGTDLLFARNLTGGSRLFDEAIAQRFNVPPQKAEQLKIELATLEPGASFENANAEKASRALLGPAGQLVSLLESTVMFAKSQMKISGLKVDRVMLCGGGAACRGLDRYLSGAMNLPVELFDPFRVVDTTKLDPESAELLEEYQLEAVVALGLATTASDPEAYSIEVLPESERKKRDFWGGKIFLVAAAALAVLWLGYYGFVQKKRLSILDGEVSQMRATYSRLDSSHRKATQLIEENRRKALLTEELFELKGSGEQLARVLGALDEHLPDEFWVTDLSSQWAVDEDLGVPTTDPVPIVRVKGRAREGVDTVTNVFGSFVRRLSDALPEGSLVNERMMQASRGFQIDMALLRPAAPDGADSAGDGETEEEG